MFFTISIYATKKAIIEYEVSEWGKRMKERIGKPPALAGGSSQVRV